MALGNAKFRTVVELLADKMQVNLTILDRESEKPAGNFEFSASEVHDSLKGMVALYGIKALLADRTSDTNFGTGATPDQKIAAWNEVAELLRSGVWERERKAGAPVVSAEVEALAAVKGITVAEAQAALRKYDKATREKILSNEKIVAKAKEIREARGTSAEVDLADLA